MESLLFISEQYYAESLGKIWAINVPWYVGMIFALIKPFLSKTTRAKINIIHGEYQAELLKDID
jgi:hypothetical protein